MRSNSLQTARLRLAAVSPADLEEFHALHSDPAVYRHAPDQRHPDLEHSASVIEGYAEDWARCGLGYWSVRCPRDGSYLGCAGVRRASASWNIYYRFAPSAWGNGYAAEVIRASAPLAEQLEPGAMLQATMQPWNTASRAVAESLGMRFCLEQLDHAGVPELIYQLPAAELG